MTARLALLLVLAALAPARADDGDEERAATALARVQDLVAQGFLERALAECKELARKYPATQAGLDAARRAAPNGVLGWAPLELTGPSANRVDVVVTGDGYTLKLQDMLGDVAKVLPRLFERDRTLGEYKGYFNFWRLHALSAEHGIDGYGRDADTPFGGIVAPTIQGHATVRPQLVRDALALVPEQDGIAVVYVQRGSHGTAYPGVAVVGGRGDRTSIHEFGHAFALLQDEYADTTGHRPQVRSRINVSATDDPEQVPWRHWIEAGVPGIGVYEGAAGRVRGAWKPTASGCVMEHGEFFCPPCREALVLRIYSLVDPIEAVEPAPHAGPAPAEPAADGRAESSPATAAVLRGDGPFAFRVRAMRPETHPLEIRWWVVPERGAPLPPEPTREGSRARDRRARGPLQDLWVPPARVVRPVDGEDRFVVKPAELPEKGTWRVVCRVRDTAQPRGERHPWVLADPDGVLESEVGWWLAVE